MQGAWRCCLPALLALAAVAVAAAPAAASSTSPRAQLQRQLDALVATPGGPPGAIVTLHRGRRTTVLRAGVADVRSRRKPRATDHMRIASIAKAFTAAVVFRLVWRGQLRLGDTIGERRPAATRDGQRGVTSSVNISAPSGELLARLREARATAVCALLRD